MTSSPLFFCLLWRLQRFLVMLWEKQAFASCRTTYENVLLLSLGFHTNLCERKLSKVSDLLQSLIWIIRQTSFLEIYGESDRKQLQWPGHNNKCVQGISVWTNVLDSPTHNTQSRYNMAKKGYFPTRCSCIRDIFWISTLKWRFGLCRPVKIAMNKVFLLHILVLFKIVVFISIVPPCVNKVMKKYFL